MGLQYKWLEFWAVAHVLLLAVAVNLLTGNIGPGPATTLAVIFLMLSYFALKINGLAQRNLRKTRSELNRLRLRATEETISSSLQRFLTGQIDDNRPQSDYDASISDLAAELTENTEKYNSGVLEEEEQYDKLLTISSRHKGTLMSIAVSVAIISLLSFGVLGALNNAFDVTPHLDFRPPLQIRNLAANEPRFEVIGVGQLSIYRTIGLHSGLDHAMPPRPVFQTALKGELKVIELTPAFHEALATYHFVLDDETGAATHVDSAVDEDTEPPMSAENFDCFYTSELVTLKWERSESPDVAGYTIHQRIGSEISEKAMTVFRPANDTDHVTTYLSSTEASASGYGFALYTFDHYGNTTLPLQCLATENRPIPAQERSGKCREIEVGTP